MKLLVAAVAMVFATACMAQDKGKGEPFSAKTTPNAVQNDNCVKKDKNGKCPPLPNSPKPTPKKKVEKS